jgi:TMEM175 potassium channel family protein
MVLRRRRARAQSIPRAVRLSDSNRVEAFSDGVLAITITLLVFEVVRPSYPPGELLAALLDRWPQYLAFAASFLYVGVIWLNHHTTFTRIRSVDRGLHWANLMLLFSTALLPFPTAVLATTLRTMSTDDMRTAVALYAIVAALMCLSWLLLFEHLCTHPRLRRPDVEPEFFRRERMRAWVGIVLYSCAWLVGWWTTPMIALVILVALPVFYGISSEGLSGTRPRPRRADGEAAAGTDAETETEHDMVGPNQ